MWSFGKKKKEDKFSGIKNMELEFVTTWRRDRKEVEIMTNKGPFVLNEKTKFFVEISTDNFNPIKIQIVPDFDKKILNFIEVLDPSIEIDKNKGVIKFSSSTRPLSNEILIDKDKSIDTCLIELDKDIEKLGNELKCYNKTRRIFISFYILLALISAATFIMMSTSIRYLNIIIIIACGYRIYQTLNNSKKIYEKYDDIKKTKDNIFCIKKDI